MFNLKAISLDLTRSEAPSVPLHPMGNQQHLNTHETHRLSNNHIRCKDSTIRERNHSRNNNTVALCLYNCLSNSHRQAILHRILLSTPNTNSNLRNKHCQPRNLRQTY